MAFSDLGHLGAGGSSANNQNSLTVATVQAVGAEDLVVVAVSVDNRIAGGGDDLAVRSVTIGGVALTLARQNATDLAAQAGSSVSVWFGQPGALASGVNIVATFQTPVTADASALSSRLYSVTSGNLVTTEGSAAAEARSATPGQLDVATANHSAVRVRAIGCEFDGSQSLIITPSWTAWNEAASAANGTTNEQVLEVESRVLVGTSSPSNPSLGSGCDNASVYVAFQDRWTVLQLQNAMNYAVWYSEDRYLPLSGVVDENTRRSIREFERIWEWPITGQITPQLLAALEAEMARKNIANY